MRRKILFGSLAAAALLGMPHLARADFFFSVRSGAGNTYNVYKAVTDTAVTWDQARAAAATTNYNGTPGHLVTMSSLLENRNVWTNAGNRDYWIGLTDSSSTSSIDGFNAGALGGHEAGTNRAAGSGWVWVTGEPYSDIGVWGGGEPNDWQNGVPGEDAAHFRAGDGLWNDHLAGPTIEPAQGTQNLPYVIEYDTELASNPWSEWRVRTYQSNFATGAGPQITNYASADALINGVGLAAGFPVFESIIATDTTDFFTNPSPQGHSNFDQQVPGLNPAVDNDDFVVVGTGTFSPAASGNYIFRTNTDDGSRLRLSVNGGPATQVITDDVLSAPHDATGTIALNAGDSVAFDWMWFERGGGAEGELMYSSDGGLNYYLVGDDTGGLNPNFDFVLATYKSNPGNAVTGPALNTLADADSIRNPAHLRGEAFTNTFNQANEGDGFYPNGGQAPGLAGTADDIAVYGDGFLEILTEGDYRFATLSDDGARLIIDGVAVINDDTLHGAGYPGDVKFGTIHLTPGYHPIEVMYFERGGGASGELFLVDANNQPIALVGDVLNGGLRVLQVPEPSTLVLGGLGLFGLALGWMRKKFKK